LTSLATVESERVIAAGISSLLATSALSFEHRRGVADACDEIRRVIVIGGSAGALAPLRTLVARLPTNLPATVLVAIHIPAGFPSILPELLGSVGPLPAAHPRDQEQLRPGRILVAPPDYHLLVERGVARLTHGPRENRHRPAIDTLFRSAAHAYGAHVIGVILSGELDDGSAGLTAIKMRGGIAIAQDPEEAASPEMPSRAIQSADIDHILPAKEIGGLLGRLP